MASAAAPLRVRQRLLKIPPRGFFLFSVCSGKFLFFKSRSLFFTFKVSCWFLLSSFTFLTGIFVSSLKKYSSKSNRLQIIPLVMKWTFFWKLEATILKWLKWFTLYKFMFVQLILFEWKSEITPCCWQLRFEDIQSWKRIKLLTCCFAFLPDSSTWCGAAVLMGGSS